ncbi:MAG: hypothetical protein ACKV2O_24215 [Acidimicrobiales bacterium]
MLNPPDRRFRLGVNYWPARAALTWWEHFDAAVVAADFQRIAAAGFDSVRLFLTWEAFQPDPHRVDGAMLDRLVRVADLAAAAQLTIMPTLFTGHMSGANLLPGWAMEPAAALSPPRFRVISGQHVSTGQARNWYDDDTVLPAQVLLAGTAATALAGHPALWAWDLGNENSNCAVPPNRDLAVQWLARVTDALRHADPGVAITIGLHMEDLESDRRLGPAEAATVCDFLCMHGYPIYAPWAHGPTDDQLLGFLTEITSWLGGNAPVLFSEFGLPTIPLAMSGAVQPPSSMLVEEAVAATYTDRALDQLQRAGATGALLWCAHDYAASVWNDPPFDTAQHERHFGMWRQDGSPKPALAAIRSHHGREIINTSPARPWIDIEPDAFYTPDGSHLPRLYQRYRAHAASVPIPPG